MDVWPGQPYPLGATYDGSGTNFSLYSSEAEAVQLCLFDDDGTETRVDLEERTAFCWHCYLPRVGPGQVYGYRVAGRWAPHEGLLFNPTKLLLDPYAKAVEGGVVWDDAVFPYRFAHDDDYEPNLGDSAAYVPKSVVTNPFFEWGVDRRPRTPLHQTVIYELHVKGFTQTHPGIPEELRGTYAGLCHVAAIEYFRQLGITAIELQPVHQFIHDHRLVQLGLRNYWGYNSIAYLAPHNEYRSGPPGSQVQDFKHMVKTLHEAGIEVILDVVYNHTGEGNHLGPMLSMKGIDNRSYYRVDPGDGRRYVDYTGTGNSLNPQSPHVLQLIMDSLRYWVTDMHVDGFRFDLAATLAREFHEVDRLSSFFDIIQQDPIISQVKLIAEPWDVGEGGYQVGNFPPLWSEWNGKYRDTVRDFWRGADQTMGEFASRFTGSSDLYESNGRRPSASVNFVTAHDGYTLDDLVSYERKHNLANGEDNRDGTDDNRSWNCGAEGPTDDHAVTVLRGRQKRNFLTTMLLSQGVPMLTMGDELGRTQRGNNNAYCQDNATSWLDWRHVDPDLFEFSRWLIALRRNHPVFRRRRWFEGRSVLGTEAKDIGWFRPDGRQMTGDDWGAPFAKTIGVFLNGRTIPYPGRRGEPLIDDDFFVVFHAGETKLDFTLPDAQWASHWNLELDTADVVPRRGPTFAPGDTITVLDRSVLLLRHPRPDQAPVLPLPDHFVAQTRPEPGTVIAAGGGPAVADPIGDGNGAAAAPTA